MILVQLVRIFRIYIKKLVRQQVKTNKIIKKESFVVFK